MKGIRGEDAAKVVEKECGEDVRNSQVEKDALVGHDDLVIIGRAAGALVIGAMIGFERTFHGRPAGFRTHSLVCIASAILMIVTVYQNQWMTFVEHDAIRTDPTRMAQGIMTGIGFLGAGVIFKEGLTVRGLTTAASIWVTAAIGILLGTLRCRAGGRPASTLGTSPINRLCSPVIRRSGACRSLSTILATSR